MAVAEELPRASRTPYTPWNGFTQDTGWFALSNGAKVPDGVFKPREDADAVRLSQEEAVRRTSRIMFWVSHHTAPQDAAPAKAVHTLARIGQEFETTRKTDSPVAAHLAGKMESLHGEMTAWQPQVGTSFKQKVSQVLETEWQGLPAYAKTFQKAHEAGAWLEGAIDRATARNNPAGQRDARVWQGQLQSHNQVESAIVLLDKAGLLTPPIAGMMNEASENRLSHFAHNRRADWAPEATAQRAGLAAGLAALHELGLGDRREVMQAAALLKTAGENFEHAKTDPNQPGKVLSWRQIERPSQLPAAPQVAVG